MCFPSSVDHEARRRGVGGADVFVTGFDVNELGALRFAPGETLMPRRSTNSPPNQPPTNASNNPRNERTNAPVDGMSSDEWRSHKLPAKRPTTTTFTIPWMAPM